MNRWYAKQGTSEVGPGTEAQILSAFRKGTLTKDSLVRKDGDNEWVTLRDSGILTDTVNDDSDLDAEREIGGFLLLVAFKMIISPFILLYGIKDYLIGFSSLLLLIQTRSPLEIYLTLLVGQMVMACFVFQIVGTVAFFRKSKLFPKIFISLELGSLSILLLSFILLLSTSGTLSKSDVKEFVLSGLVSFFWIIVFSYSARVKQTFVKKDRFTESIFNRRILASLAVLLLVLPLVVLATVRSKSVGAIIDPNGTDDLQKSNTTSLEMNNTTSKRISSLKAEEGLKHEEIADGIRQNMGSIQDCYLQLLSREPQAQGKIKVFFIIGRDGSVTKAIIKESNILNRDMQDCVLARVREWEFARPRGGKSVDVEYPFVFNDKL